CGELTHPVNGRVEDRVTTYRGVASYTCNPGYDMIGSNVRTCTDVGLWDGNCFNATVIGNGTVSDPVTTFGAVASYTCDEGYNISSGDREIRCGEEGTWVGVIPECSLYDCQTLTIPANGQVDLTQGTLYGAIATYSCNSGFYLEDEITRN
ncbi:SVEP1-like protein, partial [Mya arenaria]